MRPLEISPDVLALFQHYDWPGNVRELYNVLERAACAAEGPRIEIEHLPLLLRDVGGRRDGERERSNLRQAVRDAEREAVLKALKMAKGNKAKAAKLLRHPPDGFVPRIGSPELGHKSPRCQLGSSVV